MGGLPKHLTHHSLENWLQSEEFAGNQRVNQQLREGYAGAVEANVMPLIFSVNFTSVPRLSMMKRASLIRLKTLELVKSSV